LAGNKTTLLVPVNTWTADWVEFYTQHRLGYQFQRFTAGGHFPQQERLAAIPTAGTTSTSLVHGDLWGGNAALLPRRTSDFDPAVYFGDREVDVAMTELFGGFPLPFIAAITKYSLTPGYERRRTLYNLYHINHFNLFGGGYIKPTG